MEEGEENKMRTRQQCGHGLIAASPFAGIHVAQMLSAILTGVNRAFPFATMDDEVGLVLHRHAAIRSFACLFQSLFRCHGRFVGLTLKIEFILFICAAF